MPPERVARPMSAIEREVLEWVAGGWQRARPAANIANAVDKPLPKVQAALARLRDREAVAYFDGRPGSWAVTAIGRALVNLDAPHEPTERYRMALETLKQFNGRLSGDAAAEIARLALGGSDV